MKDALLLGESRTTGVSLAVLGSCKLSSSPVNQSVAVGVGLGGSLGALLSFEVPSSADGGSMDACLVAGGWVCFLGNVGLDLSIELSNL
jgi:hypothetical protein